MSDNYAIKRYHRQTICPVGTSRKKKFLVITAIILLAGIGGMVYLVHTSGILAEDNPGIASRLATGINQERYASNLQPVVVDSSLSSLAYTRSREVKISSLNYVQGANRNPDGFTDVLIISKLSWVLSGNEFRQQILEPLENDNPAFRNNIQNPELRSIGIGVTSDNNNYYIVTQWKA